MIAARRTRWNFALQRAVEQCVELGKPLVILEPLDVDYPWASDRLHRFVLDGMAATAAVCRWSRALYYPYVEPEANHGRGLLQRLSQDACIVITDHYPAFFIPRLLQAAARASAVRVEAVDRMAWSHSRARTRVHLRAIVSRVRPARASAALARISRGAPAQAAATNQARVDQQSCSDGRLATALLERRQLSNTANRPCRPSLQR